MFFGVGGHHQRGTVIDKVLLVLPSLLVGQARVVAGGGKSVPDQMAAYLVHLLSRQTVDDAAFAGMLLYIVFHRSVPVPGSLHGKVQIFPVKSSGHDHRIPKLQKLQNVVPYLFCGCSCKGADHRTHRKSLDKVRDP